MVKKGVSVESMAHSAIIFLLFAIFLAAISPSVSSQDVGCCGNPGMFSYEGFGQDFYCEEGVMYNTLCCPELEGPTYRQGFYNDTNDYFPDDPQDCLANFFSTSCSGILSGACTLGCCYNPNADPTQGFCSISTEYMCRLEPEADWTEGGCTPAFYGCDLLDIPGTNGTLPPVEDSCSVYDGDQDSCTDEDSCFYCTSSNKCFSTCFGNCPGYFTDLNSDRICDSNNLLDPCATSTTRCQEAVGDDCLCGNGVALEGQYCCQLKNLNFNDPGECSQECILSCGLNQKISDFLAYYPGSTECICGAQTANLTSSGNKYCCSLGGVTSLSDTECTTTGTLTGKVYDSTNPAKIIPGASVVVGSKSATVNSTGHYKIEGIFPGSTVVVAYNRSYMEKSIPITIISGMNTQDIALEPFYSSCDNPSTIPAVTLNVECFSDDQKAIRLSWNNPCPGQYVFFQLYRNKVLIKTWDSGTLTYIDTDFRWEQNINYTLTAGYQTISGSGTKNTTKSVFSGYEACLGNVGNTICANNVKVYCAETCAKPQTQNCTFQSKTCVEHVLQGTAECVTPSVCLNLGNPFGVFYDRDVCYSPSSAACYYDYSKTTINKCSSCLTANSCSSFLSADACYNNPCGYANICSYLYTNTELGKGICYREGDFSSSSCELCNDPLMGCSSEECDIIGNCGMTTSGCLGCGDVDSCEQYLDEYSCTGGQPYEFGSFTDECDVETVTFSDDSCGIGYCVWDFNTGKCTSEVESASYVRTSVTIPSKVLVSGDVIKFNVTKSGDLGGIPNTYYCITPEGSPKCCPDTEVSNGNIQLSPTNTPTVGTGLHKIYYYSTISGVYSPVGSRVFYADMSGPSITGFDYAVEDYTPLTRSNATIYFNVSEDSRCNAWFEGIESALQKSIPLYQRQRNQYIAKYINLSDGEYSYTINCTDYAGNNELETHIVSVDRTGMIVSYSPIRETLKTVNPPSTVTITVSMHDDGTCSLKRLPTGEIIYSMDKTKVNDFYVFSAVPTQIYTGYYEEYPDKQASYAYLIECSAGGIVDSAISFFTIDNLAPVSTLNHTPPGAEIEGISVWHRNNSIFSILCSDPSRPVGMSNFPPMFGCSGARYCTATNLDTICTIPATAPYQDSVVFRAVASKKYCYQSKDAGGNVESVKCTTVLIDSRAPKVPSITLSPRFVTKKGDLNITLKSVDYGTTNLENGSGLNHFQYNIVKTKNVSGTKLIEWQTSTLLEGESFILDLGDLDQSFSYGNTYYLVASATDNVGQTSDLNISQPFVIECKQGENYTICNSDFTNCTCDDCGDGKVQDGEECDDGNKYNTDECTNSCELAECGDGHLYEYIFKDGSFIGEEECDDGNNVSGDGCSKFCKWESCGDGIKQASEACDDGNNITSDSCINCHDAYCGDGYVYSVKEACDYLDWVRERRSYCNTNCTYKTNATIPIGTCTDGQRNGDEGDVDCGGSCPTKCGINQRCGNNSDCLSGVCNITAPSTTGFCVASLKCSNGVYDAGEADVDCGGICPAKCSDGKRCTQGTDCQSLVCKDGKCAAATCSDGFANGAESDVDCGGSCPSKCSDGKKCKLSSDCSSGICKSGYCAQNPDADGDGIDDSWEVRYCDGGDCDPDEDIDNDGLTNLEEYNEGTDPKNPDSDGDGWKDGKEVEKGTDPLDPDSHPSSSWWIWLLLILILLIVLFIIFVVFGKSKKKEKKTTKTDTFFQERPASVQPQQQTQRTPVQPQKQAAPVVPLKKSVSVDHSDIFKSFDDQYSQKVEGSAPDKKTTSTTTTVTAEVKKKGAADLEEGVDMPGWMKDRSGVWKRLEKMNTEELDRLGKTDANVSSELSGMYGKRLDKNAKDSLSKWVLSGLITKENLPDMMRALAKEGRLNKSMLRYILADMLSGKKMGKVEMKSMLKDFAEKGILSKKDSDDMVDYVREL